MRVVLEAKAQAGWLRAIEAQVSAFSLAGIPHVDDRGCIRLCLALLLKDLDHREGALIVLWCILFNLRTHYKSCIASGNSKVRQRKISIVLSLDMFKIKIEQRNITLCTQKPLKKIKIHYWRLATCFFSSKSLAFTCTMINKIASIMTAAKAWLAWLVPAAAPEHCWKSAPGIEKIQ